MNHAKDIFFVIVAILKSRRAWVSIIAIAAIYGLDISQEYVALAAALSSAVWVVTTSHEDAAQKRGEATAEQLLQILEKFSESTRET